MYFFADSFDLYSAPGDFITYWDGTSNTAYVNTFAPGRFPQGWGIQFLNGTGNALIKTSNQNDTVHHIVCAIYYTQALGSGTVGGLGFALYDGTTIQCWVGFCNNGDIVLTSAASGGGTVLARYTGAVTLSTTWFAFEFEIIINNTTGAFRVRKNGNPTNDFQATNLDTQQSANAYANKLIVQPVTGAGGYYTLDDLIWRSDPSIVPFIGDVRSYTRRPANDAQAQWSRPATFAQPAYVGPQSPGTFGANIARYNQMLSVGGSIGSVILPLQSTYTGGNVKCCFFNDNNGKPGTILQAADAPLAAPTIGNNTFTFTPPVVIPAGTTYWLAICVDSASASGIWQMAFGFSSAQYQGAYQTNGAPTYAAFPVANPAGGQVAQANGDLRPVITLAANANAVADWSQDGTSSYVYSTVVGQTDMYGITPLTVTPQNIIACVTRAFAQKSDAGTRNISLNIKSGPTNSAGASIALFAGTWSWTSRIDLTDPNTGAAWTATAVNNIQIGAAVTA